MRLVSSGLRRESRCLIACILGDESLLSFSFRRILEGVASDAGSNLPLRNSGLLLERVGLLRTTHCFASLPILVSLNFAGSNKAGSNFALAFISK